MILGDDLVVVVFDDEGCGGSDDVGKYSESVHELPAGIHSEVDQTHQ